VLKAAPKWRAASALPALGSVPAPERYSLNCPSTRASVGFPYRPPCRAMQTIFRRECDECRLFKFARG
jgi:hypothetical protein